MILPPHLSHAFIAKHPLIKNIQFLTMVNVYAKTTMCKSQIQILFNVFLAQILYVEHAKPLQLARKHVINAFKMQQRMVLVRANVKIYSINMDLNVSLVLLGAQNAILQHHVAHANLVQTQQVLLLEIHKLVYAK